MVCKTPASIRTGRDEVTCAGHREVTTDNTHVLRTQRDRPGSNGLQLVQFSAAGRAALSALRFNVAIVRTPIVPYHGKKKRSAPL